MRLNFLKKKLVVLILCILVVPTFCFLSCKVLPDSESENETRVLAYYSGPTESLDNYDVTQMTHIIYCFGQVDENSRFTIRAGDTAKIQKMVSLKQKNPKLKVILSIGGGRGCTTCSDAFSTEAGREEFAKSMNETHKFFGTDGLDLDWEFPNIEHFPGQIYSPADKKNYTELVKTVKKFNPDKELSFAAGAHVGIFEEVVEWEEVMKYMDYVNMMTYDILSYQNRPNFPEYRDLSLGEDSKLTNHHTALYSIPDQLHSPAPPVVYSQYTTPGQERSVDWCTKYLLSLGIPRNKIIVGCAFYGRMYDQVENANNGLRRPGRFRGTVQFKNMPIQLSVDSGYVHHWDDIAKAPYVYNPEKKIFVTYDDKQSVELKMKYVIDNNLGGIMFWQLTGDTDRDGLLDVIDSVKKNYKP